MRALYMYACAHCKAMCVLWVFPCIQISMYLCFLYEKTVDIFLSIAFYLMHAPVQIQTTNIRKSMFPNFLPYPHKIIIENLKGMYPYI